MNILDNKSYSNTLKTATKAWGEKFQQEMVIEECAELILELRHLDRGKSTIGDVMNEVVDVLICCNQIIQDNNLEQFVESEIHYKMLRLQKRVEANDSELR